MRKLVYLVCVLCFVAMTFSITAFAANPAGKLSVTWGEIKNSGNAQAAPPKSKSAIEMDKFVNIPMFSSPPWYPPAEETDKYRWAPKICWTEVDLPVDVYVYTGNEPFSGTFSAIKAGFEAWDSETGTSLYGSITEETGTWPGVGYDNNNTVAWAPIDGAGGIIGVTYYWYYTVSKKMVKFDMVLDDDEPWSTTGAAADFDVQSVVTHEAGHTLVLGDLRSPKDGALTMHAYTWPGDTEKRTLGIGDIMGVEEIYGE